MLPRKIPIDAGSFVTSQCLSECQIDGTTVGKVLSPTCRAATECTKTLSCKGQLRRTERNKVLRDCPGRDLAQAGLAGAGNGATSARMSRGVDATQGSTA